MPEFTEEDDCYVYVRRTAAHNAAHALVAWLYGFNVRNVWLDDVVCGCEAEEARACRAGLAAHLHASRAIERQCRILLAGPIAESMFSTLPADSRLARSDLLQATSLIKNMCGDEADTVFATLSTHTRYDLADNACAIGTAVDALLKRNSLDAPSITSIFSVLAAKQGSGLSDFLHL